MVRNRWVNGAWQIVPDVYIGTVVACKLHKNDYPFIVHACKYPCHVQAVGATPTPTHPDYLFKYFEDDTHLSINIVDAHNRKYFSTELFARALSHMDDASLLGKKVLVHCNEGLSRAATIGLLYLATRGVITDRTPTEARNAYYEVFPDYTPGVGIWDFLTENWEELTDVL